MQPDESLPLRAVALWLTLTPGPRFAIAGVSARALVLALIARGNPALAAGLQAHTAARPYTVAVLHEDSSPTQVAIRVTAINVAIQQALTSAVERPPRVRPLMLGPQMITAVEVTARPLRTPWVNTSSISGVQHAAASLGDTITFVLASPLLPHARPATWHDGPPTGATLSPAMLFDALRERWLALGTMVPIPHPEQVRAAARQVEVRESQIRVTPHLRRSGPAAVREEIRGFTGRITLKLCGDPAERVLLRTLAAACFYLGAGIGTATGMGRIRALAGDVPQSRTRPPLGGGLL